MAAHAVASDLRELQLVLTAACNLRCSYCYQNNKSNRRIEWDVVRAALDRLLASRQAEVKVLFIGGEPLLEFPTIERAVAYLSAHKRADMDVGYAMITNGLLLSDAHTTFLVRHDFHVKLSFDGVPPAQAIRGLRTFSKLDLLLDGLREDHPGFFDHQLTVNIVLQPDTVQWLADSVRYFVLEKRLQDLTIGAQFTDTSHWQPERIAELERAFAAVYRICRQRFRETGEVPLEVFRKTAPARGRRARPPKELSMCGVGRGEQLAVDVDGQTHGCVTFTESYQTFPTVFLRSRVEALRLGDIRDPGLSMRLQRYSDVVRSTEIFHHKELKRSSYGTCGTCKHLVDCDVCPMSIGRSQGDNDPHRVPDFNCAYNLVSLKYRAKFPVIEPLATSWQGPR
jgi:sulfatase maturation enzyme AslB (radical SAM superfamily)